MGLLRETVGILSSGDGWDLCYDEGCAQQPHPNLRRQRYVAGVAANMQPAAKQAKNGYVQHVYAQY